MLYHLKIEQKEEPTATYIFGTKLLQTIGVGILGKKLDEKVFTPFNSIEEILGFKKQMRRAHKGNVPILIKKTDNKIVISGRLYKSGGLAHDPNIGALSLIGAEIRKLGWTGEIVITKHA